MHLKRKSINLKATLVLLACFVFSSCSLLPALPTGGLSSSSKSETNTNENSSSSDNNNNNNGSDETNSSSSSNSSEEDQNLIYVKDSINNMLNSYGNIDLLKDFNLLRYIPFSNKGPNETVPPKQINDYEIEIDVKGDCNTREIKPLFSDINNITAYIRSYCFNIKSSLSKLTADEIGLTIYQNEDYVYCKFIDPEKANSLHPGHFTVGTSKGIETKILFSRQRIIFYQEYLNAKYHSKIREETYGNHKLDIFCDIKLVDNHIRSFIFKGLFEGSLKNLCITKDATNTYIDIAEFDTNEKDTYKHYVFNDRYGYLIELKHDAKEEGTYPLVGYSARDKYISRVVFFISNFATIEINLNINYLLLDTELIDGLVSFTFDKEFNQFFDKYFYSIGHKGRSIKSTLGAVNYGDNYILPFAKSYKQLPSTKEIVPLDLFIVMPINESSITKLSLNNLFNNAFDKTGMSIKVDASYENVLNMFCIDDLISDRFNSFYEVVSFSSWVSSDFMNYYTYFHIDSSCLDFALKI